MKIVNEDGAPLNVTAGVEGPVKKIGSKDSFKKILGIKKKKTVKPHSVV